MIMKIIAILSLILVCWCPQSHHHIFMLISAPLGLASEEFIPVSDVAPKTEVPPSTPQDAVVGSQDEQKSDKNTPSPDVVTENELKHEHTVKPSDVDSQDANVETPNPSPPIPPSNFQECDKAPVNSQTDGNLDHTNDAPPKLSENGATLELPAGDLKNIDLDTKNLNLSPSTKSDSNQSEPDGQATQKEEEPIPSFMEWTQLQQKKMQDSNGGSGTGGTGGQNGGQNGHKTPHTTTSQQNKSSQTGNQAVSSAKSRKEDNAKNFASPDCGAKVIQSNPESQNANGVLSSSHDEYMLNKCGINIWFIVELCEPLKIEKVSLGNLELFSSSPKEVEIGISDRYPTREWNKLGPFMLPDIRAIHSIMLPATNASTFGKFLKVSISSHYGTEHFCPLSLVRVNGISEYEVLESENTHAEDMESAAKEESALYEEPVIDEQEGKVAHKSVFGSAKDAVINIVKKAAQVLVKSDASQDSSQQSDALVQSGCRSLLQCLPNYEMPLRDRVLSLLACNFSNLLPFLSKNSPWCGWDYCHGLFSKHSIGLPWQPEGFYASIFGGPSVLHALCNYHRPLTKDSCDTILLSNNSANSAESILTEGYVNESLKSLPVVNVGTMPETSEDAEKHWQDTDTTTNGKEVIDTVPIPESGDKSPPVSELESTTPPIGESGAGAPTDSVPPPATTLNPPSGQLDESGTLVNQQGSSFQQQQKESVFVRLSNRIKTLERNQSLTSSYLEELSRRFKKQNEENHNVNEGTKKFMNETRVKVKTLEDLYRFELRSLRRNTEEIRERLFNVQLQRSLLILLCFLQFLAIICTCLWVRSKFRHFESQLESVTVTAPNIPSLGIVPVSPVFSRPNDNPHVIPVRRRLNSELSTTSGLALIDKSKKIKKKKKKLAELKPVSVKNPGPASAPVNFKKEKEFTFSYSPPITSTSVFDIPANFKENICPLPLVKKSLTPPITSAGGLFQTKVDSPFSMISSSAGAFTDSGVSTSSRFALLASPGPSVVKLPLKRSGSLTSLDSSSTSSNGTKFGGSGGSHGITILNGHSDSQSQGSSNGKKRKNKGLKALMPKLFDR